MLYFDIMIYLNKPVYGDQLPTQKCLLPIINQFPMHGFLEFFLQGIKIIVNTLDIAIFTDQLKGGFGAYTGHTWNIVSCITGKPEHVNHLLGLNSKLLPDTFRINPLIFHGIPYHTVFPHQLHEILVSGDHHCRKSILLCNTGVSADEIIRLITLLFHNGNIQSSDNFFNPGNLYCHVIGHGRAVGLILIIDLMAECGAFHIKKHGQIFGFLLFYQF